MESVFLTVLNMSFTASWVILILVVLRPLLKRAPRWIVSLLWCVPLLRLLCPVSFESVLSLMPVKSQPIPDNIAMQAQPEIDSGSAIVDTVVNNVLATPTFTPDPVTSANPLQIYQFIGTWLWVAGMLVLAVYSLLSLWMLYRRLRGAVPSDRNVYWCQGLETAFVVGLVRPKIYLPAGLGPAESAYILRHEEIHIRRMDHWLKAVAFVAVCIHWFNPLVWIMFSLLTRDMEMACDEAVLSELGEDKELKRAYSASLLNLAAGRRIMAGTPLAFGEGDVKSRVKNVLNFRRPKTWAVMVALGVCILLGVGLLANRVDNRVQIGYLDSLDDLGDSAIKGSIQLWYEQCRHDAGVIHTYPLEDDYVGPREDGYLVYYRHGTDHYSYFELEVRAKGDDLEYEIVEHDAVNDNHVQSELFAIVRFEEGEFPLDDVELVDEELMEGYIADQSSPLRPNEAQNMAYIEALEGVLKDGIYPNGNVMPPEVASDLSEATFAVYDVDREGVQELIVNFYGGPMAAKETQIYAYDEASDSLRLELADFPNLTYYDNGLIEAGWSHNQGRAGNRDDFWPYTLYRYYPKVDAYVADTYVDAWDKAFTESGPGGLQWPAELDDGEGLVYWIMVRNINYDAADLVSAAEYAEWRELNFGGAREVEIPFKALTAENIAALAEPGGVAAIS